MVIGSQMLLACKLGRIWSLIAGVDLLLRVFLCIHLLVNIVVKVLLLNHLFEFALSVSSSGRCCFVCCSVGSWFLLLSLFGSDCCRSGGAEKKVWSLVGLSHEEVIKISRKRRIIFNH